MIGRTASASQLFLGNVAFDVSEHELEVFLANTLAPTGVVSVGIPKANGCGTGIAFLELDPAADVDAVRAQLDGMPFRGRALRVACAVPGAIRKTPGWCAPPEAHVFVGGVDFTATEDALKHHVVAVAAVEVVHVAIPRDPTSGRGRGIGFVSLRHAADAARTISLLDGVEFQGRALRARPADDEDAHADPMTAPGGRRYWVLRPEQSGDPRGGMSLYFTLKKGVSRRDYVGP